MLCLLSGQWCIVTLEHLSLKECSGLTNSSAPRLSALTQLRTLDLIDCEKLASLPDLSALTQLQTLDVSGCRELQEGDCVPETCAEVKWTA